MAGTRIQATRPGVARSRPPITTTAPQPGEAENPPPQPTQRKGRAGRRGPTGNPGKGLNLRGLGAPPVTVSAPPEHNQKGGKRPRPLVSGPRWQRPGGVTNGPDQEHSPGHVLPFGPSKGLRVGHTVHRGRQETGLSRKDSPATHSVPDPGIGNGWSTWLRSRSFCAEQVQTDDPYNRVTP